MVEHDTSVSAEQLVEFSRVLEVKPWSNSSAIPFWVSWFITAREGEKVVDHERLVEWCFPKHKICRTPWVEPDCSWDAHAEVLLPTSTGPRPASSVHPRSANSVSASAGAPARWVKHSCRLHVRHDEAENMITCSDGSLRLQGTREREVSGFQPEKFIFICIWIRHCWCRPAEGLLQQVSVNCDRASVLELPQA